MKRYVVLAALIVLGLVWKLTRSDAPASAPAQPATTTTTTTTTVPRPVVRAAAQPAAVADPLSGDQMAAYTARAYEEYLAYAAYPPSSRPAGPAYDALLHWNETGATSTVQVDDVELRVSQDRYYVTGDDALTLTVEAEPRTATALQLSGAVQILDEGAWPTVATLAFEPGRATGTWTARFVPAQIAELRTPRPDQRIVVSIERGAQHQQAMSYFAYAATQPIVVLGTASDRVVDGSLEVLLDVDLARLGPVLVQAALYDPTGTDAIAIYEELYQPTAAGRQQLPLRFFGKVLRERGVDGPYVIKALHGSVTELGGGMTLWQHDGALTTRAYRASQFSPDEWTSPDKTARIQHYQDALTAMGM